MTEATFAYLAFFLLVTVACGFALCVPFLPQIDNWLTRWKKRRAA